MIGNLINLIFSAIAGVISVLPSSFVQPVLENLGTLKYVNYINYFIPFYLFADIGAKWLVCCLAVLSAFVLKNAINKIR